MARIIYPINGKTYTAEDVEIINSPRTSGIYSVLDFDCSLSGNVLTIGKGLAWIKNGDFTGKCVAFTEPETLTLDSADSTKNRFDVVAIRYDASKTEPELVVIKGEAEAEPVIPRRSKETYLYELFLYAILRKAGEGSASVENLIDLRTNETYCGLMRDSVTSAVVPAYETIFDVVEFGTASLYGGATLDFDYEKYQYLIADVGNTIASCGIVLPLQTGSVTNFAFSGSNFCVKQVQNGDPVTTYFRMQVDLTEFSDRGHVITLLEWSSTPDFSSKQNARLDRLVGVTKQPEGYVKVDSVYNPESHNAQSGEAVKQAIEEALEGFEGGDVEIPENVETTDNKVTSIDENSTDEQYPSAKAVNDFVGNQKSLIEKQVKELEDSLAGSEQLTSTKIQNLSDELLEFKQSAEESISDVTADITQNQTDIADLDEKFDLLKTNVDLLNEGGLLMKEDIIGRQVNGWLDEHPEATTTVQDDSLTSDKMNSEMKAWIRSNAINVKDFGAVGDGVTDDTKAIKNAFATLKDYGYIVFPKGHYIVTPTSNKQSFIKLTGLKGITIDLNGSTIEVATNSYPNYNLFELIDCENFVITNGFLKGDRLTHDYTTTSGTHEFGYAIYCNSSLTSWYPNIGVPSETLKCCGVISNLKIFDFTGDGVVTKNGMSPGKIEVLNCEIHHCRRQGISVLDADTIVVDNCHIHHIGTFDDIKGASPMSGIDIEPGSGTCSVNLVDIRNTTITNNSNDAVIAGQRVTKDSSGNITEIKSTVKEVLISSCNFDVIMLQQFKSFDVSNLERTKVIVKDSILNQTEILASGHRYFYISDGIFLNCILNATIDTSENLDFFMGNKIKGCVLNLKPNTRISYVEIIDSIVNGGLIYVHESANSTIRDCTNTEFNNCEFSINNVQGLYKFVGCSFRNCTPFASSKAVRFRNCYFDSKYVPGADYVNCIIEDEI